jgi:hypothetical protein
LAYFEKKIFFPHIPGSDYSTFSEPKKAILPETAENMEKHIL